MSEEEKQAGYDKGYQDAKDNNPSDRGSIMSDIVDSLTGGSNDYEEGYDNGYQDGKK